MNDILISVLIYLVLSGLFSSIFFSYFNFTFVGGYWGAFFVGFIGSVIGAFAFDHIFCKLSVYLEKILIGFNWLMKNSDHKVMPPINVIAALAGCLIMIFILKKMTPD